MEGGDDNIKMTKKKKRKIKSARTENETANCNADIGNIKSDVITLSNIKLYEFT